MNRQPLWSSETKDGETMYQFRAREGSGVDEVIILWNHAKHTFEAVALLECEPVGPDFVFTRIVSPGADDYYEANILPDMFHYEPDHLLAVIANVADILPGLRAALIQDRNRANLARRPVACTPDEDRRRIVETHYRYHSKRFRRMSADPQATRDALFAQRCRLLAAGQAVFNANAARGGTHNDEEVPF